VILSWLLACGAVEDTDCAYDPALTWANEGSEFTDQYCNGCHSSQLVGAHMRNSAPDGVNFDTWQGAADYAERIAVRTDPEAPTMPPGGGPTRDELVRFNSWIACDLIPERDRFAAQVNR
jgi:uncharacterized membrane protein